MERLCKHHGLASFSFVGGVWRCLQCENSRKKKMRDETKAWINALKNQPCLDCNLLWPSYVMDFHHREKTKKITTISRAIVNNMNKEKLLEEIKKCDLICANCHRIREYQDEQIVAQPGSALG